MVLESLPNEILHEILQFFDIVEIFRAFYNLNGRFNSLLLTYFHAYHVKFHSVLKYQADFPHRHYLPLIANQIVSLRLSDNNDESSPQTDFFFSSGLQLNQFTHLRSLSLCYIDNEEILRKLMVDCHQCFHLTHLKVVKCQTKYMSSVDFCNIIWNLPKLTHCRLDMQDNFCMPTVASSSLKYLSISCQCWWLRQTVGLFQQTPRLHHLHVPFNNLNENPTMTLPSFLSITVLKLSDVRSSKVMNTTLRAMPNLTHLKVDTYYINCDGYVWEEIINDHLPKLEVFRLRMHIQLRGKKNNEQHVDNLVDSFRTRFWLEKHQWYIRCHQKFERDYSGILLYSLPYAFGDFNLYLLTMTYNSTCSQDNDYCSYDRVNNFHYNFSLLQNWPLFIQFPNIRNLQINLPFDKHFWRIIPTLHQLHSLTVSSAEVNAQFDLQLLLDRAPCLYSLTIKSWPASQIPIVLNNNTSVRRLDMRMNEFRQDNGILLSREECNTFIDSPLAKQCEELLIGVKNRESILDLVNNMGNLRILHIVCHSSLNSRPILYQLNQPLVPGDNDYENPSDILIKWLQDQLPAACIISKFEYTYSVTKIWISFKKT